MISDRLDLATTVESTMMVAVYVGVGRRFFVVGAVAAAMIVALGAINALSWILGSLPVLGLGIIIGIFFTLPYLIFFFIIINMISFP